MDVVIVVVVVVVVAVLRLYVHVILLVVGKIPNNVRKRLKSHQISLLCSLGRHFFTRTCVEAHDASKFCSAALYTQECHV